MRRREESTPARQAGAHVIVRFSPGNLRTCDGQRRRLYLAEKEAEIPTVWGQ